MGLIEKHVVDFVLVLIELFFARCYGWGATSAYTPCFKKDRTPREGRHKFG